MTCSIIVVDNVVVLAGIFFVAGLYVAVQEALESTVTAEMVQAETMTMSIGVLGTVNGTAKFVSSAAVGVVWTAVSPEVFHPGGWVYVDRYITDLRGCSADEPYDNRTEADLDLSRRDDRQFRADAVGGLGDAAMVAGSLVQREIRKSTT